MNKLLPQMIGGLGVVVLMVLIWRGDGAAADTVQDVFGWIGGFLQDAVDAVSDFVNDF
jgi:hypothetical protein